MKVYSFIEISRMDNYIECYDWLTMNGLTIEGDILNDFYSQPFKPELITELFEGWLKEIHNSQELYIHWENWQIEFDENDRNNKYCIYSYYGDWYKITTLKPRTLDDFINDCQRAGIELEWKEQK